MTRSIHRQSNTKLHAPLKTGLFTLAACISVGIAFYIATTGDDGISQAFRVVPAAVMASTIMLIVSRLDQGQAVTSRDEIKKIAVWLLVVSVIAAACYGLFVAFIQLGVE